VRVESRQGARRQRRMRSFAGVVATALLLASCSSSHKALPPTPTSVPTLNGTIAGQMRFVGGPPMPNGHPPGPRPITGSVTIATLKDGVTVAKVTTDRDGRFRATVPAGEYQVRGTSPHISGPLVKVVSVGAGKTANAMLTVVAT
jgi:hypothetical protein